MPDTDPALKPDDQDKPKKKKIVDGKEVDDDDDEKKADADKTKHVGVPDAEDFPKHGKNARLGSGEWRDNFRGAHVKVEQRAYKRADGGEEMRPCLVGYAAVFHDPTDPATEFQLYDDVCEYVCAGAFDRCIRENQDVIFCVNHDRNLALARVAAGTLRLSVDARGLKFEADVPPTQAGNDAITLCQCGVLRGASFHFEVREQNFREQKMPDGSWMVYRELRDLDLRDTSCVIEPAYQAASVSVRGRGVTDDVRAQVDALRQKRLQEDSHAVYVRARLAELRS